MRALSFIAPSLLLFACTPMQSGTEAQTAACSPLAWQSLLGTNAAAVTLPVGLTHRIYKRGDMVTADYNKDRLNIVTNAAGRIVEVSCG